MLLGSEDGIRVWNKLGTSLNESTKSYFNVLRQNAQKYQSVWFTDVEEQGMKILNNQPIYHLFMDTTDKKWHVELFHTPKN